MFHPKHRPAAITTAKPLAPAKTTLKTAKRDVNERYGPGKLSHDVHVYIRLYQGWKLQSKVCKALLVLRATGMPRDWKIQYQLTYAQAGKTTASG